MQDFLSEIAEVKHSLTNNRTEHLGKDVWKEFVIPRFFKKERVVSEMPTRLEGGRGSGKTMLLRYLSYHSQFSQDRTLIPEETIKTIGLYWKADTQFLRMMQKRSIDNDEWQRIFDHYLILHISKEIIDSVIYISKSKFKSMCPDDIKSIHLDELCDFGFENTDIDGLSREIKSCLRKTEFKIQNIKECKELSILPPTFINCLVSCVKDSIPAMKNTCFCVFIDEYENLLNYQQRVINTKIKHSEPPLIFNIAIKLNGMSETQTLSEEKLENRADYKVFDLDKKILDSDFGTFIGEILLKKLVLASPILGDQLGFDPNILSSFTAIDERHTAIYKAKIKNISNRILPGRSHEELAEEIFNTPIYHRKLTSEIEIALKEKEEANFKPEDFIDEAYKKISIVCSSLLFRDSISPEEVVNELKKLKNNQSNKFKTGSEWEHNNFIGSYLRLILSFKANSTFYSGFDVYTLLLGGNVRHFLELCRTAFSLVDEKSFAERLSVDQKTQHIAARISSEEIWREIQRFTPIGNKLSTFVSGLGKFFQVCQSRKTQSEPEVTHFHIKISSNTFYDIDVRYFLDEAEKWGVLKPTESTKSKSETVTSIYEYVLNPIYAPFFYISYRKNRKADLENEDIQKLYSEGAEYIPTLTRKLKIKIPCEIAEERNHDQGDLW